MRPARKNNKKPVKRRNQQRGGGVGSGSRAPRVLGSQQIQTQIKVKDRVETRAVTGIFSVTSTVGGDMVANIATNTIGYDVPVGTTANIALVDVNWALSYELFKIKKVEVVWNPIVAPTTAVPSIYVGYDEILSDASFSALSLTTVVNYNNTVHFDPRMGTSYTYRNKAPSSSSLSANVVVGGWQPTGSITINNFSTSAAYTGPGTITNQGSGLGNATLLGRFEVTYLIAVKGRK